MSCKSIFPTLDIFHPPLFSPFPMMDTRNKLERILDAMTDDIFSDIECAKSVINEAGYDSTISSSEGSERIKQLQDNAFKTMNKAIVYNIRGLSIVNVLLPSLDSTVFHVCNPDDNNVQSIRDFSIRPDYSESNNSEDDILLNAKGNSKCIDDRKLLFN